MIQESIFLLMGGLGLFFFGMKILSEGLKQIAGDRLKNFLHAVTKHPIYGVLVGMIATALLQSSSATTVMVIGFINAGLLNLAQAISLIMGANIGTTLTAWLVSSMSIFKITSYALPAIGIGFAMRAISKTERNESIGRVILGFGLLFLGLSLMKDAFIPLKESQMVSDIFVSFAHNPLLGILVGIVFTVILQSSSATIAIVQVLAFNGLITFEAAIPIILGDNIGTTVTAQMAAIGANINARRGAMSHTIFNTVGTAYMLIFLKLGWFVALIHLIIPGGEINTQNIMFYIAVSHSVFNVVNTLVFLPFIKPLEQLSIWLVPKTEDSIDYDTQHLERHLLDSPNLAIEQTHKEICYMLKISRKAMTQAVDSFIEIDMKKRKKAQELEDVTDHLQGEITQYIIELSQKKLKNEQSEELPVLIHNVNDLERIGDYACNVAESAKRRVSQKLTFSDESIKEIKRTWKILMDMFDDTERALNNLDTKSAERVLLKEEELNAFYKEVKNTHIKRLKKGQCHLNSGFVFVEIMNNLEKVGDRLTNVSESVQHQMRWQK